MFSGMKLKRVTDFFYRFLPVAALIVVVVLRFINLNKNDIALDEPFTVFFSQGDLSFIGRILPDGNNPPFFYIMMHFWIKLFGISPLSVRFLPAIFSILTVVMMYQAGRRFFTKEVGFLAGAILTFSCYHQVFAHEARMYSLFGLLTVTSMYLFFSLMEIPGKFKCILCLALVNAIMIYTHFFGFLVFLVQILAVVLVRDYRKTGLKRYSVSLLISLLLFAPYFKILFTRFLDSSGGTWVAPVIISDLYTMIWRYTNAPVAAVLAILILFLAGILFIYRLIKGIKSTDNKIITVFTWFLVPYLLMFLISFKIPVFLDRYTVFISTGFALLLALSLDSLLNQRLKIAGMILFTVIMAATFKTNVDNKREFTETVDFIKPRISNGTGVIICPPWLEYGFAYHYDQALFQDYRNLHSNLVIKKILPVRNLQELDTGRIINDNEILFFEEWSALTDPQNTLQGFLNRHFSLDRTTVFPETFKVHHFIRR